MCLLGDCLMPYCSKQYSNFWNSSFIAPHLECIQLSCFLCLVWDILNLGEISLRPIKICRISFQLFSAEYYLVGHTKIFGCICRSLVGLWAHILLIWWFTQMRVTALYGHSAVYDSDFTCQKWQRALECTYWQQKLLIQLRISMKRVFLESRHE